MKKAFLISIGPEYPAPYQIYSPPNDANNWAATLQSRGFSISRLQGANATKGNILSQLNQFIISTLPTDNAVVGFFGHGSYVTDTSGDEPDGKDECFVSVNMQAVTDDEIRSILSQLRPGAKLDVVLECCYSGTGTRAPKSGVPHFDLVTPQNMAGPLKATKPKAIVPVGSMNHRLWATCADNQISYGGISGGLMQSVFSLYACWVIRNNPSKNATELMNIIAPYVQAVAPQNPQLEGINLTAIPF